MDSTAQEQVVNILKEKFEGDILSVESPYNFLTINLKENNIIEIIRYLYSHPETKFQYLTTLCGIHYPDLKQIAVMYQLHNLEKNYKLRLRIFLPEENPVVPTLTTV